ncbi:zinc finger protein 436-like [Notolabrus celidotus]|uniref:zinc finger protein 436-like n=1 Tax=Notolabrus celidotus TaxID=1203425 RepID=UPI0014900B80|nr:zinc finger protein 436-like [Notolabrus celidotus]
MKRRRRKSDDVSLRVCLLQDANANILKKGVLKSPMQEVRCPRGLQEAEFLDLLRSSFPQLTEQFDAFTTDTTRKLKPLHLETMTPEKIQGAIKSRGRGRSALYVRVKAAKESQRSALRREDANDDTREETEEHGGPAERAERPQQHTDTEEEHPGTSEDEEWKPDKDDEEIQRMKPKLDSSETMNQNNSGRRPRDFSACSDRESDGDGGDEEWRPGEDEDEMEDRINKPHSSGENSGAPLSCRVCQALKGSTSMLIKHSWSHVEDPERLCGVCGEPSESPEELRSHLNTHRRTHSCDVCGKNFLTVVGLQEHATVHGMEKRFRCEVCGKAYASKNTLKSHQWEHVEDKPHRCDVCHQSFAFKQQLRIHSRTHTGEKPYTCDLCGKSVSNLRSLSRHKLTHSGEKRYSCRDCGKRFVSLGGLKQHETIHTDRDRTHLCEICCKAFHKRAQLNVHMASHGDKKFMCDICGKGVSQKSKLKAHMRIHTGEKPYGCSDCGKRFNSSSYLTEHKLVHSGVKSHVCSVCGKTWSLRKFLKVHMRTHNGERPYKCSICDKGFTQNHCLKTHMKSHQGAAEDGLMD